MESYDLKDPNQNLVPDLGYGCHVDFNNMVAPIAAINEAGTELTVGSGFLVEVGGQIYLVTVAHMANYQPDQTDDWSLWNSVLTFHDEDRNIVAQVPLFDEDKDARTPLFKYGRATDPPGRILDLILLPLSPEEPMANISKIFVFPDDKATYSQGDEVTMLGRRDPWPQLSVTTHVVTEPDSAIMHMEPEGKQGDSGGPVISATGSLVGMIYGSGNPHIPGAMVISAAIIEAVTGAVDGFVDGWSYSEAVIETRL